jgi:ParB family transcriptional regulator, chromosome partitioning protein
MSGEAARRLRATLARFPPEWVRAALSAVPGGRFIPWASLADELRNSPMIAQARRDLYGPFLQSMRSGESDMSQTRRLGRGLEALLGSPISIDEPTGTPGVAAAAPAKGLLELSIYEIDRNPYQPRKDLDEEELNQLAESIKEHGLLQPIVVRRVDDRYQIIAGERRLRAATKAGMEHVAAQVRDVDDRQMAELAIVENLQRKDLGPLEKAASFHHYLQTYRCTQEELAGRLKINRSTIANLIRLLELPEPVQKALREGKISQGHARALLPLGDEQEQIKFARRIVKEDLSVREVESRVKQMIHAEDAEPLRVVSPDSETPESEAAERTSDPHLTSLEVEFRAALGTRVEVKHSADGRGRIVIHFESHEEFERLRAQLNSWAGQMRQAA